MSATATLGNSETDATPGNNVATSGTITVNQKPAIQTIWVAGLTATNPQSRTIAGTVTISGDSGPVANANVTINVRGFFVNTTLHVTTNGSGVAQYSTGIFWAMNYTVAVTGVSHGSDVYDSSKNVVTSVSVYAR